jgi:competence protein ComEC
MLLRGSRQLTITCMDVGQGDGILLQLPTGENALIDGGSSSKSNLWDNILSQTVKYYGIRRLDYIFLSHADQDHISGIEECLEAYESGWTGDNIHGITIGALVLPPTADEEDFEDLIALARQKGIPILRMQAGDCIYSSSRGEGKAQKSQESSSAGTQDAKEEQNEENTDPGSGEDNPQWSITCLSPDSKALAAEKNQNSMVLRLQYGSFSMLFTGDLEKEAEATLAASGTDLRADILKAGHHGSANATSEAFLAAVQPTFAIISCSENNSYGHPAPATLARLTDAQTQIRQTPSDGAIKIQSDGRTYTVSSYME